MVSILASGTYLRVCVSVQLVLGGTVCFVLFRVVGVYIWEAKLRHYIRIHAKAVAPTPPPPLNI